MNTSQAMYCVTIISLAALAVCIVVSSNDAGRVRPQCRAAAPVDMRELFAANGYVIVQTTGLKSYCRVYVGDGMWASRGVDGTTSDEAIREAMDAWRASRP